MDKIEIKEGYAGEVLSNTTFPKIDMAYIDGNHFYEAVRHDFFATLQIASKKFKILFDDYYYDDPENVKKVIDNGARIISGDDEMLAKEGRNYTSNQMKY